MGSAIATLKRIPEWVWRWPIGIVMVTVVYLLLSLVGFEMPKIIGVVGHERAARALNILIFYGIFLVPFHLMMWWSSPGGEEAKAVFGCLFEMVFGVALLGVAGGFVWRIAEQVHAFLGR